MELKTSDTVMIKDNDADTRLGFNFRVDNHLIRACIYIYIYIYISVVCIYVMCLKYKKNIYIYITKKYSKVPQPFLVWGQTKLGRGGTYHKLKI